MRALLLRSVLLAAGLAVLVVAVPAALAVLWAGGPGRATVSGWLASGTGLVVGGLVGLVVLALLGLVVAVVLARRWGRTVAQPLERLAEAAERLSQGRTDLDPVVSGVPEVDRVSAVLVRSARDGRKSLAAERDFASDASHQLRTPLTALLMRLEEISETDDPGVVKEEATIAIDQVERLTKVVDDLLMRSRRGNDAPRPEVSLDSVIAALQREWQPAFEQARRSVRVHGERGLVVKATPVALSQVLSTLLENSLVHGRGTVEIQARRSGPSVVIEVSDQGDGVPAAIAPHIFERSVSSGKGSSTGLGLALARDLAESNGGRLDLVATQPAGSPSSSPRRAALSGLSRRGAAPRRPALAGEDEGAVGPEPHERGQADADDGVDVDRQLRRHVQQVVGEVEPARRDEQPDAVDDEEEQRLVVRGAVAAVPEGPHPVADPRERRGDGAEMSRDVVRRPSRTP